MPIRTKGISCIILFFFQAEDGIRDGHVTGVQTCALPIFTRSQDDRESRDRRSLSARHRHAARRCAVAHKHENENHSPRNLAHWPATRGGGRSEERRVGKEWGSGGGGWSVWECRTRGCMGS